uniref:Uncharacterized protein n=1 Tax=Avena sativa TaxID=4498 RepID=A0ACD5XWF2_AVESA
MVSARPSQSLSQRSGTKRSVENDGPRAMSPYQTTETHDSTRALVIHPNLEICSTWWLPDEFKEKDLEIDYPVNVNIEDESYPNGSSIKPTNWLCVYPRWNNSNASTTEFGGANCHNCYLIGSMAKNLDAQLPGRAKNESWPNGSSIKPTDGLFVCPRRNNSNASTMESLEGPIVRTADLISAMDKNMDAQLTGRVKDAPRFHSKVPSLELGLKTRTSTGYFANSIQKAMRNALIQDISTLRRIFSRDSNTYAVSNQGGARIMGSSSPHGNNYKAVKTACPYNMMPSSDASLMKQGKYTNRDDNITCLDLSSKRPRSTRYGANAIQEEHRKVLTLSHVSAFKRYDTSNQAGGACWLVGRCLPHGEAQTNRNCAVHEENGGSSGANQSNVTDPWAPAKGSNNNTINGRTSYTTVNRRVAARNRYNEKKKRRNFMKTVRYERRKIQAEQRPRVHGQFIRKPPQAMTAFINQNI